MGAKQSATKKETVAVNASKVKVHQYEEIDDDELFENQKKIKDIQIVSQNLASGPTLKVTRQEDQAASNHEAGSGTALGAAIGSTAAASQTAATKSPQINKRYHPYDEIPDDKFSSNQKAAVDDKEDVKSKKKDKSKIKFGPKIKEKKEEKKDKKKNAKKYPELVTDQSTSEPSSVQATSPVCTETNSLDHLYSVAAKNQPKTGADARITTTEDQPRTKDELNTQDNVVQCKAASTVNGMLLIDSATGRISPVRKPKAAPRFHTYTDISDSHLTSNKDAQKMNSEAGSKLTIGTQSPNLSSCNNTCKVLQETVVSNGVIRLDNNGDYSNRGCIEVVGNGEMDVTVDSEPVEYLNVAALACCSPANQEKDQDILQDVYAVPQKKKDNPRSPKPLNYIEVEFNPSAPRAKVSQPHTPTNYCNAITKDGKIVLLES